jgi:hypothetical protein
MLNWFIDTEETDANALADFSLSPPMLVYFQLQLSLCQTPKTFYEV